MTKNKHLVLEDRIEIQVGLKEGKSFNEIGKIIGKHPTTISKEIKTNLIVNKSGCYGRKFNNCLGRSTCNVRGTCNFAQCPDYIEECCELLMSPPYVCNACNKRNRCTLEKHEYKANDAQKMYEDRLSYSREGYMIDGEQDGVERLEEILVPLIKNQGQSIHHAVSNNLDTIMYSERTIYRLINDRVISIKNMELPRKVRFRRRTDSFKKMKIDKKCLENRRYEDFKIFISENSDTPIVQMDSVEGCKGSKVLLTIHFVNCSLMLAFIRDHNDSQSVIDIFNNLYQILGKELFIELFPLILTDNGSEFSNPKALEYDNETGE